MKAAIFIDCQQDFIDKALKNEKAQEVLPKIVDYAKRCLYNGYKLYATRDTHQKSGNWAGIGDDCKAYKGYLSTLEGEMLPTEHCIEGTDGWMLDSRLEDVLLGHCTYVNKDTFGSFDLADILAEDGFTRDVHNEDEIVLCGFVTSICVLTNAAILRTKFPNTKITVKANLCAGLGDEDHRNALNALRLINITVDESV